MTTAPDGPMPSDSEAVRVTRYVARGIDCLNVRMGPGTSYPVVGVLVPGARMEGLAAADWLQITRGPLIGGWLSRDYLTLEPPAIAPSNPCPHITGRVTSDDQFANIRTGPGFSHPVAGRYLPHEPVIGSLVDDGPWIRTERGFVNSGTLVVHVSDPATLNGRIPLHLLAPIPLCYNADNHFEPGYTPDTPRYLNGAALAALHRLQRAFRRHFGHFATIDLSYRTYDEQHYWFDKFGSPRAAHPGTSNHGYGLALDFEERDRPGLYSWGAPANRWLLDHQTGYGFDNPYAATLQEGEDYHFNFVG